ncbi:MAG: hypothetical protein VCF24_18485 [Candidatus Latescibacterota bacterium]|jgi:hypothetical protein
MKRKSLLSGAMLLCLAGCVPVAVNPFIAPERGGVDERLVGDWVNDEELNWRIETRPGGYLIHQRMIADSSHARYVVLYEATTATLDGRLLLDIHLRRAGGVDGLMWYHVVPGHTLSRIDAVGDTLRLAMLDNRWLKKQLDSGALVTPHFLLPPAAFRPSPGSHRRHGDTVATGQGCRRQHQCLRRRDRVRPPMRPLH